MIVENDLDLVVASHDKARLVFLELEVHILPDLLHVFQHILDLEFLELADNHNVFLHFFAQIMLPWQHARRLQRSNRLLS